MTVAKQNPNFASRLRKICESSSFQGTVLILIALNAVVIALEATPEAHAALGDNLHTINVWIQRCFVVEVVLRIASFGARPWMFFRSGWNLFDFLTVFISMLPSVGAFATVARLARILRVARVITAIPELRLIVATLLKTIPSLGYVGLLLALMLFIYGVLGHSIFRDHDPENWGSLASALITLFQILTLEGWTDYLKTAMKLSPWCFFYFASFILTAVYVIVNLFIAVVMNNLESAKDELLGERQSKDRRSTTQKIAAIRRELDELESSLNS